MRFGKENWWTKFEDYIESKIQDKIGAVSKAHMTAGTAEEWVDYDARKKTTGYLYYIAEGIDWINSFCYRWSMKLYYDPKFWFKNMFIHPRWRITAETLNKGQWYDLDTSILHINMQMLVDFIEGEKDGYPWELAELEKFKNGEESQIDPDDENSMHHTQWQSMETAWEIYSWWKDYPRKQKQIEDIYDEIPEYDGDSGSIMAHFSTERREVSRPYHDRINALEEQLKDEEEIMLMKLIGIRGSLWT
jgi:hypothetical protein